LQGVISTTSDQSGSICLSSKSTNGHIPMTEWPVSQGSFKALVHLETGQNDINLTHIGSDGAVASRPTSFSFFYEPLRRNRPLELVLLTAKNSSFMSEKYQSTGATKHVEAMAKFRMGAYLWQTYLAEHLNVRSFGRRTFQLQSVLKDSTVYLETRTKHISRQEAPIDAITLDKTVDEMKQLSREEFIEYIDTALVNRYYQKESKETRNRRDSHPKKRNLVCVILDGECQTGGVSFGGRSRKNPSWMSLAICSGDSLFAYPSAIEEVFGVLSDNTITPEYPQGRGFNASKALAHHLQLIGRMFGLSNEAYGIMSGTPPNFADTFCQANSVSKDQPLHPLNVARLRHHPAFMRPGDKIPPYNTGLIIWGSSSTAELTLVSKAGILAIEIIGSGDGAQKRWIDFLSEKGSSKTNVSLRLADINEALSDFSGPGAKAKLNRVSRRISVLGPPTARKAGFRLQVMTSDGRSTPIVNFTEMASKLVAQVDSQLRAAGDKRKVCRSVQIGVPDAKSRRQTMMLPPGSKVTAVRVYHTYDGVSGIEFVLDEGIEIFGTRQAQFSEFPINWQNGECFFGLAVRVRYGVRAVSILTSGAGRGSDWFGHFDYPGGTK
jgi:hypothetical protein